MSRKLVLISSLTVLLISLLVFTTRVQRIEASATVYIRADGSVDPVSAPISNSDDINYTLTDNVLDEIVVERSNITIDGNGYTVQGTGASNSKGFHLHNVSDVEIRNVTIREFAYGVYFNSTSHSLLSGVNITQTGVRGIHLHASSNNTISGNHITNGSSGLRLENSPYTTISGNNIVNHEFVGIEIISSENSVISGNHIVNTTRSYGGARAINLYGSSDSQITGNNITNSNIGIRLTNSNNTRITQNNVTTTDVRGIYMWRCYNASLSNNLMVGTGFGFGVEGDELGQYLHSIDTSNLVNNKPIYYLINVDGAVLNSSTHPEVGYLALINSTNITVEELNLTNSKHGLLLAYTNNSKIQNNSITSNSYGVYHFSSSNNTISGNQVTHNNDALRLTNSSNIRIYGNNISHNGEYAIEFDASSNNSISRNNIVGNNWGIYLYDSSNNNRINGNNVTNSVNSGIYLEYCLNNSIYENNIASNDFGIEMDTDSSSNSVYHNNFINNTDHFYSYGLPNSWDNGYLYGGNFWSGYAEVDLGHDGIGDLPLVMDADNRDNYPLMGTFHSFNTSLGYRVNVISNSTIENFQYFEENTTIKIRVSNMTANQTYGFGRISIPHALMTEPYSVTINDANPTYWNYRLYDNGTHRWIYFSYQHSTLEIVIIPEFLSLITLSLMMVTTLLAAISLRKKRARV